jgi:hypothetical protein
VGEFNLALNLWHELVQNIEKLLAEFVLQLVVVLATLTNWFVCPLFEPFIETKKTKLR